MKHPISTLPYEMNSVIESGTDLNDYRTAGIYFFSYANRPSNLPPDGYGNGWCLVLPSSINSENYCTQIWISFGNNATTDVRNKPIARRTYFNGTWTDWWKLPCTGEYTSPTDVTDAITTALADYIPRNTTEVTATTEAEFEQTLEELPQSPPKIYFFHVLQGTSTRIGLPTGRYGIEVYAMGSTLRTVIAYSYNNDQKTYKKIRTAGTSGSWSSWLDITNTDTLTNLGTTVTNLGTQVGTNTTNISTLQNQVNDHLGYATYYVSGVQKDIDLIFDYSFMSTTAKGARITYCNGMITMIGYLDVNTEIRPILGSLNSITRLTNDFLPGTGGIIEYFAGYNTEIGIGHMEGTELRCKLEQAIPPNTQIEFHATFPCSKSFAYIDNLLEDYKIAY